MCPRFILLQGVYTLCIYWYAEGEIRIRLFSEIIELLRSGGGVSRGSRISIDFLVENRSPKALTCLYAIFPRAFGIACEIYTLENRYRYEHELNAMAKANDFSYTLPPFDPENAWNRYYRGNYEFNAKTRELTIYVPDMDLPYRMATHKGTVDEGYNRLRLDDQTITSHIEWCILDDLQLAQFRCDLVNPLQSGESRWFRWYFEVPSTGILLTRPEADNDAHPFCLSSRAGSSPRKRLNVSFYQIMGPYQGPYQVPYQVFTSLEVFRAEAERSGDKTSESAATRLMNVICLNGFARFGKPTTVDSGWITIIPASGSYVSDISAYGSVYLANYGPQSEEAKISDAGPGRRKRAITDQKITYQFKTGDQLYPREDPGDFAFPRPENKNPGSPGPIRNPDPYGRFRVTFYQNCIGLMTPPSKP